MYKFVLENKKGDSLTFNEIGGDFSIVEIAGLNPPTATINTSEVALIDGQMFDSAKLDMRTLDVAFAIENSAAQKRIDVYKVLKSKQEVRAYYKNDYRNVYIDGYISSIEITYFEIKQVVTVTIVCPRPYWNAAQTMINELSQIIGAFHFPFSSTGADMPATVNLTPYFSHDISDIYNATTNPNGYWYEIRSFELGDTVTMLEDGWAHVDMDNSARTSAAWTNVYVHAQSVMKADTDYTLLMEIRNFTKTGGTLDIYQQNDTATQIGQIQNTSANMQINAAGVYRFALKSKADISSATVLERRTIRTFSGVKASFDIRLSLYEGEYTGDYAPYEDGADEIVFSYIDPVANVEIANDGDIATGIIIDLYASASVSDPKIIDCITGEYIALDFTMQQEDLITIDTRSGEKTITLLRNGVESNIFNSLADGSTWLQLDFGGGVYTYEVGAGEATALTVTITHNNLYGGV